MITPSLSHCGLQGKAWYLSFISYIISCIQTRLTALWRSWILCSSAPHYRRQYPVAFNLCSFWQKGPFNLFNAATWHNGRISTLWMTFHQYGASRGLPGCCLHIIYHLSQFVFIWDADQSVFFLNKMIYRLIDDWCVISTVIKLNSCTQWLLVVEAYLLLAQLSKFILIFQHYSCINQSISTCYNARWFW